MSLRSDIHAHLSRYGRPKRSFASREDAKQFLRDHPNPKYMLIYECPLCTQWHMATGFTPRGRCSE